MNDISKKINTSDDEIKWIADYKATGNLLLLGELYEPYMPLIYGIALKYFKSEAKSKDAVIEIFEVLINKLKTHEIKNFRSWLYVLSKNYCLMQLRKENQNFFLELDDTIMESEPFLHPDNAYLREQQINKMEKCMDYLTTEQKTSISLFYLEQKCYAEVAKSTGYEINKVKSYIQNGKRNLKICIEKQGD